MMISQMREVKPGKRVRSCNLFALIGFMVLLIFNGNFHPLDGPNGLLASADKKGVDLLFLKDKFILKDKKGSIVISDEKNCCECPNYHHF